MGVLCAEIAYLTMARQSLPTTLGVVSLSILNMPVGSLVKGPTGITYETAGDPFINDDGRVVIHVISYEDNRLYTEYTALLTPAH